MASAYRKQFKRRPKVLVFEEAGVLRVQLYRGKKKGWEEVETVDLRNDSLVQTRQPNGSVAVFHLEP